tara:strand:+ start:1842 stop:2183 length:342 start_codon:yes stop_codon:yes gene_type:complete
MSDFKFIKYQPTPDDQYMLGIASVLLYGKVIVRYKLVQSKDQKGNFFCVANYTLTEHGEKKYVPCVAMDSNSEKEMLEDFIRENVNRLTNPTRVNPQASPSARYEENEAPLPF